MKKIRSIALIVVTMIGVLAISGYTQTGSGNFTGGTLITKNMITYKVNVYPSHDFLTLKNPFYVVVTDGSGKQIAAPQLFKPGQTTYVFYESGPVTGMRGATMFTPESNLEYYLVPEFRENTFTGGRTYLFNLYPSLMPI